MMLRRRSNCEYYCNILSRVSNFDIKFRYRDMEAASKQRGKGPNI